jgi:hypothetical protein
MTWFFAPVDDVCLTCKKVINPKAVLHYIVWDREKGTYKRECAVCRDQRCSKTYAPNVMALELIEQKKEAENATKAKGAAAGSSDS